MTTTADHIAAIRGVLETWADIYHENSSVMFTCSTATINAVLAELDRLNAENERMRQALEFYDCHGPLLCDCTEGQEDKDNVCCGFRARAALKGDTHGN